MGSRMATNLVRKCNKRVVVYDVNPQAVQSLESQGATAAATIEQVPIQSTNAGPVRRVEIGTCDDSSPSLYIPPLKVAEEATTLITMLPNTHDVKKVMEGTLFAKAR